MKAILPGRALLAAMVCLSARAPAQAAFTKLPAVPPPLALVIQESTLDSSYEYEPPFLERTWVQATLFGVGGFLTGYLALRRITAGRRRGRTAAVAGALVLISGAPDAGACINVESETLEETYLELTDTGWFTGTVRNALKANPANDPHLKPNPAAYSTPPAPGVLESDEAARMIIRGDAAGALVKLQEIEAAHPGLYQTAANMGTAYELTGDDEKALEWIKTGIQRNPYSHMNAEWLHVLILEAKIAMKTDPEWLKRHNIIGITLTDDEVVYETLQGPKSRRQILESIRSQATVRALFIKPKDPILAELLLEAVPFAKLVDPGSIPGILDLAEEYGATKEAKKIVSGGVDRDDFLFRVRRQFWLQRWFFEWWPWVLFGVMAILGAWVGARRGRKLRLKDHTPAAPVPAGPATRRSSR